MRIFTIVLLASLLLSPLSGQSPAEKGKKPENTDNSIADRFRHAESFGHSHTPELREWKAPKREKIKSEDYPSYTADEYIKGPMAKAADALKPAYISGGEAKMNNPKQFGKWTAGKGNLTVETKTLGNGKIVRHGYAKSQLADGTLEATMYYKDGELHGPMVIYYKDGAVKCGMVYNKDFVKRQQATFTANGKLSTYSTALKERESLEYHDNGLLSKRTKWEAYGIILWSKTYNKHGELLLHKKFSKGKLLCPIISWAPIVRGKLGVTINKAIAGRMELLCYDENGETHGWQTIYNRIGGYRWLDTWYEHGVQTGKFIEYNREGKEIESGSLLKGKKNGKWTFTTRAKSWGKNIGIEVYEYKDGVKQGKYTITTLDGLVLGRGKYVDGLKQGVIEEREVSGNHSFCDFVAGKRHGSFKGYDGEGVLISCGTYSDGMPSGEWMHTDKRSEDFHSDFFEADAIWVSKGSYNDSGPMRGRIGKWTWTQASGKLGATGQYSLNGSMREGDWRVFHEDGKSARAVAKYGPKSTTIEYYNDKGVLEMRFLYKPNGITKYGEQQWFHANGNISKRGSYQTVTYSLTAKYGDWNEYDENAVIVKRNVFDRNILAKVIIRESALVEMPAGIVQDPEKFNGIIAIYKGNSKTPSQRLRVINDATSGLFQKFDDKGVLRISGVVRNNLQQDSWKTYNEAGVLTEEVNYVDGKASGEFKVWRADSTLERTGEHTAGVKTGTWVVYHPDGKTKQTECQLSADGKYSGKFNTWFASGKPERTSKYKNNLPHGDWIEWYENGKKRISTGYFNGKENGKYKDWYEDGSEGVSGEHKFGIKIGKWQKLYANGKTATVNYFTEDGEKTGIWKTWDEEGKLTSEEDHNPKPDKTPNE